MPPDDDRPVEDVGRGGELRRRLLASAVEARRPGRSTAAVGRIGPTEVFLRTACRMRDLLDSLDERAWQHQAVRGLTVQQLVGHLIGVELAVQVALDETEPAPASGSPSRLHVESTQQHAEAQDGVAPTATLAAWWAAVEATVERLPTDDDPQLARPFTLHGVRAGLGELLVFRAIELWMHGDDIAAVAGVPSPEPDVATVQEMAGVAVPRVPTVLGRLVGPLDGVVRVVLTGPGGGTWTYGRDDDGGTRSARIVTDVVSFCRLLGNRLSPTELPGTTTGDAGLLTSVLGAAQAMALD